MLLIKNLSFSQYCIRQLRNAVHKIKSPTLVIYPGVQLVNSVFSIHNTIYGNTILINTSLGALTYIQSGSIIINTQVGAYTSIAHDVKIGLGSHPVDKFISTHPVFYSTLRQSQLSFVAEDKYTEFKKTIIGSDVLIGSGSTILDGVSIGNGAVVGAGSVVTHDVKPFEIVAGAPAKHIRFRFEKDIIEKLQILEWWNDDLRTIQKQSYLFLKPDEFTRRYVKLL